MPGYETHSRRAIQVGVVAALAVAAATFWTVRAPVTALVAGALAFAGARVGGNAPDIDSHSSIPRQYFDRSVQVLTAAGVVGGSFLFYDAILAAAEEFVATAELSVPLPPVAVAAVGVALAGVAALVLAPRAVGAVMPSHRGLLHNPLLWIGIGTALGGVVVVALLVGGMGILVAGWVGGAVGGGLAAGALFAHLLPDGELI